MRGQVAASTLLRSAALLGAREDSKVTFIGDEQAAKSGALVTAADLSVTARAPEGTPRAMPRGVHLFGVFARGYFSPFDSTSQLGFVQRLHFAPTNMREAFLSPLSCQRAQFDATFANSPPPGWSTVAVCPAPWRAP